ncbi:UDP-2,3-diacylglucosamine diphosphatase LpxI [bacterium]|nr:UDP-2,3-diacylglucosamine diphosphatase LpxI [bacterium]MBU4561212.1 UDP-2,3-diacylglucosamine diphosphatase LpxI [bacterium]MCG2676184.1 UDP-2,3-diacylglucosamine diphosphatase LpxI [bacterium]MCG2677150.1 UDP-2,3-diacylglucosamine diphosphatase LpxI [bacterium]
MKKIGLIAGKGKFPLFFIRALRKEGREVVAIGIKGEVSPGIEREIEKVYWVGLGELKKLIKILKEEGIEELAMVGRISKESLFTNLKLDDEARSLLTSLKDKSDDSLLGALREKLARVGIRVADPREFLSPLIPQEGMLTKRSPSQDEMRDVEFGKKVADKMTEVLKMSSLTVVVKNRVVLAVESAEGTDETIRRGGRLAKEKAVVVKVAREEGEIKLDLPVVGTETLKVLKEVNASCLAIDARKTILLDRERLIEMADEAGIAIVAQ